MGREEHFQAGQTAHLQGAFGAVDEEHARIAEALQHGGHDQGHLRVHAPLQPLKHVPHGEQRVFRHGGAEVVHLWRCAGVGRWGGYG